jgi:ribosomal protein S17E
VKNVKARAFALLNRGIDKLQETFPPNRVVVLLTPIVFAPAAGYVTALVAKQIPGVHLDSGEVTGLFIAGAIAAVVKAYKWLDGWQKETP